MLRLKSTAIVLMFILMGNVQAELRGSQWSQDQELPLSVGTPELKIKFQEWIKEHEKIYESVEEMINRFEIWLENHRELNLLFHCIVEFVSIIEYFDSKI